MDTQQPAPFLSFKRRKSGAFYVVITTPKWFALPNGRGLTRSIVSGLVSFFSVLDRITQHRAALVAVAGIGLGLGLSVTVFRQPTAISAVPSVPVSQLENRVEARELRLPGYKVATPITWNDRSAGLGDAGVVLIEVKGSHPVSNDVRQLQLGDAIQVVGSNNGLYYYRVVETREVSANEFGSVLQHTNETVVVYTPTTVLGSSFFVAIARPAN